MGTRADFYVGRGEGATWLGSIAYDGYPEGDVAELLGIKDEHAWKVAVHRLLVSREDGTTTDLGWPWPWDDSNTTDFSYTWDDGVWVTCFGYGWKSAREVVEAAASDEGTNDLWDEKEKTCVFPNMKDRQNVAWDKRSGIMLFGPGGQIN
jgi:hypothetical protein